MYNKISAQVTKCIYRRNVEILYVRLSVLFTGKVTDTILAVYLKVMKLLAEALMENKVMTRRDIYYHDVPLFRSQKTIDECVKNLCATLKLDGQDIGAVASKKGLVFGDFKILPPTDKQEPVLSFKREEGSSLIPDIAHGCKFELSEDVEYILVVEKDAVFNCLCSSPAGDRILITGKGYPDSLTKIFTACLLEAAAGKNIGAYCLTDSDIYGILIFKSYMTAIMEHSCLKSPPACASLEYFGVYLLDYENGYIDIKQRDYSLAKSFLKNHLTGGSIRDRDQEFLNKAVVEAQRGMYLLKKMEMNVVEDLPLHLSSFGIENYIRRKLEKRSKKREMK